MQNVEAPQPPTPGSITRRKFLKIAAGTAALAIGVLLLPSDKLLSPQSTPQSNPEYPVKGITKDLLTEKLNDSEFRQSIFRGRPSNEPQPSNQEIIGGVENIMDVFFQEEKDHTALFTAESKASFPYTRINVADIARKLIEKKGPTTKPQVKPTAKIDTPQTRKQFYIFPSSGPSTGSGNQFTFSEVAVIELVKHLPAALNAIREGEHPEDYEIITCGMPTNTFGEVSEEFYQNATEDPFAAFGKLFGEFTANSLERDGPMPNTVTLYGQSMSANFAVGAAEHLQRNGIDDKTTMRVLVDNPIGFHDSSPIAKLIKKASIPLGFGIDELGQTIFNWTKTRGARQEASFIKSLEPELIQRGIVPNMNERQSSLKRSALNTLSFSALAEGQHPEQIKARTFMRSGIDDPLAPLDSLRKTEQAKGKLLAVPHTNPNISERMIHMQHGPAPIYYRDNVLRRMAKTAVKVWEMQQAA